MKNHNHYTTIFLTCLLLSGFTTYGQQYELRPKIYAALLASINKEYLKSAQLYSEDFIERQYHVPADKLLYAARMWALAGQSDSAFSQLNRLANGKSPQILEDTFVDDAFDNLKNDSRWTSLTEFLKSKGVKPERAVRRNYLLIAEFAIIEYDDQHYRSLSDDIEKKYGASSPQNEELWQTIKRCDSINQQKVKVIIDNYNWPKSNEIGKEGSGTIFIVIQHADLEMQVRYLPLVKKALRKGLVNPGNLAILEDRIAVRQHKYQTYGTQFVPYIKDGKLYLYVQPLKDPENVDKRRAKVGLGPLRDYVKKWDIIWDVEQYKKDLPMIKKMVSSSKF